MVGSTTQISFFVRTINNGKQCKGLNNKNKIIKMVKKKNIYDLFSFMLMSLLLVLAVICSRD